MNDQIYLIARLKQQTRLGATPAGGESAFELLTKQAKDLYETFKIGGADVLRASGFNLVTDAVTKAYEKVNILEKQNRKLSESFGVSTMRAAQLSQQFDKVGISLGVNTDKLKTYAGELKKMFPGQAAYLANAGGFGKEIMKQAELMRNKLGLSAEVTEGFVRNQALLSQKSTDNFDTLNEEIAKYSYDLRGTYEGAFADITEGIGSLDAETAAVFGKQGIGNLAGAVLGAKKLGVELGKVLQTGTGFLDVESAIGNEIELQILGAKDLNVAAIQEARLKGDGLALTQEITKYLEANGEEMKKNPFLLQKSAEALGFSNSELLEMYANLKQNKKLELETADGKETREKEIAAVIAKENERRIAANEEVLKGYEAEEKFLADKRSEVDKAEDRSQIGAAKNLDAAGDQAEQVMKIATKLDSSMTNALGMADNVVKGLNNSETIEALIGIGGVFTTADSLVKSLSSGLTGEAPKGYSTEKKSDVFIPASGGSVVSGAFGSFELDPRDDILALPNARDALANNSATTNTSAPAGGPDTAALIAAALQGMSFNVTNTFDGDKIQSQLTIRQGQRLNAL
jgi:hypothetical protein